MDKIICNNTCPVWSVFCTIKLVIISKLPFTCTVSLTVVALKNVISSSSSTIIIWHCSSLRADLLRADNLFYCWHLFPHHLNIYFSWMSSSLREDLVLYLIFFGFILLALIFSNHLTHHESGSKRDKLLHLQKLFEYI